LGQQWTFSRGPLVALGISRLHQASEQFGTQMMLEIPDAYAISLGLRRDDGSQ
jgi:hypothetical protein